MRFRMLAIGALSLVLVGSSTGLALLGLPWLKPHW